MLTIIEVQAQLQNLTNRRISFTEIGIALGTGRANISKRVNSGSILKEDEKKIGWVEDLSGCGCAILIIIILFSIVAWAWHIHWLVGLLLLICILSIR